MGGFDKYVKRFDELDSKKARPRGESGAASTGGHGRSPWARRAWLAALGTSLIAAGAIYGPSLAGASGSGSLEVSGEEADRDYTMLRTLSFRDIQRIQRDRMDRLFQLTQAKAPGGEIEAANQAAWRANKVARELNPD